MTSVSGFFKAALDGDWEESRSRIIKLPEEDPAIVNAFVLWLEHRQWWTAHWKFLPQYQATGGESLRPGHIVWLQNRSPEQTTRGLIWPEDWEEETRLWITTHLFADHIQSPGFRNATIDVLRQMTTLTDQLASSASVRNMALESISTTKQLERVTLDACIKKDKKEDANPFAEHRWMQWDTPDDYMRRYASRIWEIGMLTDEALSQEASVAASGTTRRRLSCAFYHEHEGGETCQE